MGGKARPQIVRPGAERGLGRGGLRAARGAARRPGAGRDRRAPARGRRRGGARPARLGDSGRTSAFLAGRSASAADLQALGSRLLAFYGQHEHRKLTLSSAQLEMLDGFAGERAPRAARALPRGARRGGPASSASSRELREREGARERDLDLLRFELAEIEAAQPDPAEEAELAAERERLRHAEALRGAAAEALAARQRATRTAAARPRRWARPRRPSAARRASTPSSTRWPSARGALRGRARRTWPPSCAPTPRGSRPSPAGWSRSRSGSRRSTG